MTVIEDKRRTHKICFMVSDSVGDKLRRHAVENGCDLSKYMRALVHHELGDPSLIRTIDRINGRGRRSVIMIAGDDCLVSEGD